MSAPQIDMQRIPRHIAIIMDGNGRWAVRRGLPRTAGHQEGVETVKRITEEAVRLGVKYLTLYTFSTENWKRPSNEVAALMSLVLTRAFHAQRRALPRYRRHKKVAACSAKEIAAMRARHDRKYKDDSRCGVELLLTLGNFCRSKEYCCRRETGYLGDFTN